VTSESLPAEGQTDIGRFLQRLCKPAAILALLKDEPKPSFVHGRALLFVRIVVDRFGMAVRTSNLLVSRKLPTVCKA